MESYIDTVHLKIIIIIIVRDLKKGDNIRVNKLKFEIETKKFKGYNLEKQKYKIQNMRCTDKKCFYMQ